jgi:hypothetical protein
LSFLAPFAQLLGLLAVPIVLMYMLRLRRRQVTVSSTMLWQKLLRDREANAPCTIVSLAIAKTSWSTF